MSSELTSPSSQKPGFAKIRICALISASGREARGSSVEKERSQSPPPFLSNPPNPDPSPCSSLQNLISTTRESSSCQRRPERHDAAYRADLAGGDVSGGCEAALKVTPGTWIPQQHRDSSGLGGQTHRAPPSTSHCQQRLQSPPSATAEGVTQSEGHFTVNMQASVLALTHKHQLRQMGRCKATLYLGHAPKAGCKGGAGCNPQAEHPAWAVLQQGHPTIDS